MFSVFFSDVFFVCFVHFCWLFFLFFCVCFPFFFSFHFPDIFLPFKPTNKVIHDLNSFLNSFPIWILLEEKDISKYPMNYISIYLWPPPRNKYATIDFWRKPFLKPFLKPQAWFKTGKIQECSNGQFLKAKLYFDALNVWGGFLIARQH